MITLLTVGSASLIIVLGAASMVYEEIKHRRWMREYKRRHDALMTALDDDHRRFIGALAELRRLKGRS